MRKILIVEDEDILREMYELILSSQPYQVELAENGEVALEKCRKSDFDLIYLDLMKPVLDGVGFLDRYAASCPPTTKIIVLSNLSSGKALDEAMVRGAHRSELKANISPQQLVELTRYELEAV